MKKINIENEKLLIAWGVMVSILFFIITLKYEVDKEQHQFSNAVGLVKSHVEAALTSIEKINSEFSALFYLTGEVDEGAFSFLSGTLIRQNKFIDTIYYAEKIALENKKDYELRVKEKGYTGFKIKPFPNDLSVASAFPETLFPIKFIQPYSVKNSKWFGRDALTFSVVAKNIVESINADELFYIPAVKEKGKIFARRVLLNGYGDSNTHGVTDAFGVLLYKIDIQNILSTSVLNQYDTVIMMLDDLLVYGANIKQENKLFSVDFYSAKVIAVANQRLDIHINRSKNILSFNLLTPILVLLSGLFLTLFARYILHSHIEYNKILREQNATIEKEVARKTEELTRQADELTLAYSRQLGLTEELEAFSYSVSHDLRSPLRALDGFARALDEDYANKLDADGKDFINRICKASERMGALIDALLSLARITRKELIVEYFSVSDIANNIIDNLREENPERKITVNINATGEVKADKSLIYIVFDNLIRNAWKYTLREDNAVIEIGMEVKGSDATFYVKDNGVGFDMAYSGRLFGSFQRLHHRSDFEGDGIGLATAKRIIARHNGDIWVDAKLDKGATFYFSIPQKKSDLNNIVG